MNKVSEAYKKEEIQGISREWEVVSLKQVIKDFIVPMRDKPKKLQGHIPWCRIEDLEGKWLSGSKSNQGVDIETVSDMNLKIMPSGTVICSCSATLGVCAVTTAPLVTNQTFIGLYPGEKVDKEYLYYVMGFNSKKLQSLSSGTTIAYLSRKQFEEFCIALPSMVEQQKIVSILSSVDEMIEKTEAIIEQIEKVKKGLIQKLLSKGIGHTKFKKTEIGEVPEGWTVEKLDNIAKVIDCKHYTPQYCEVGIPIVRTNNLTPTDLVLDNSYYTSEEDYLKLTDKYAPKKGDIIYGREGSFGVASYVNTDKRFSIGQRVVVISPLEVYGKFLHLSLNADIVFKQVVLASLGTTVKRINVSDIKKLLIPVPSREEQEKIVDAILPLFQRIKSERTYLDTLKEIKKGLMQSLLTGEVRIIFDEAKVTQV